MTTGPVGTPGGSAEDSSAAPRGGEVVRGQEAGQIESRFPDPGLPAHVYRRTDVDERAAKRAERQVGALFLLSALGSVGFVVAYFAIPIEGGIATSANWAWSNVALGLSLTVSIFAIGAAAVHWAKKLMPDDEVVEERHVARSTDEERAAAVGIFREGGEATGFGRRPLIWGSLVAAFAAVNVPAVVLFRDLGPLPGPRLAETWWAEGVHLVTDPEGERIRAADIPIGGVVHVLPEPVVDLDHGILEAKADSAVLVMRLEPDELEEIPEREGWSYEGIVAYSKICTHVGCPVGLYEQLTHHLLCPCHQSTFDVRIHCEVIFGPAKRPLPQLAITVDEDGYLIAQAPFQEPVGPSYWERG